MAGAATAGRWPMRGSPATTSRTKRPRARPRPGCGRAPSSRRGTGASATRRPPFSAPSNRRRTRARSCWRRPRDRSRPRPTAPSRATSTVPANASIITPTSRWYAKIEMKISKGTRWFCSVDEAEAAGCRETGDSRGPPSSAMTNRARKVAAGSGAVDCLLILIAYGLLAYVVLPALWTHYEHQKGLADLPMVTRTAQGIPGDPINVGLVGDKQGRALRHARRRLVSRRSDHAANRRSRSSAACCSTGPIAMRRSATCIISDAARISRSKSRTDAAPITAIMCGSGRCWSRARKSGRSGSATPPSTSGVGVSHYTGAVTHHIDADIDAEREFLATDLEAAGMVRGEISGHRRRADDGGAQRRRRSLLHRRRGLDPAAGRGLRQADRPAVTVIASPAATEIKDQIWQAVAGSMRK